MPLKSLKLEVKELRHISNEALGLFVDIPIYGSLTGRELEELQKHLSYEAETQKNLLNIIREISNNDERVILNIFNLIITGSYEQILREVGSEGYEKLVEYVSKQPNKVNRTILTSLTFLKSRVSKDITYEDLEDLPYSFLQDIMSVFSEEHNDNHETYLELQNKILKLETTQEIAKNVLDTTYELLEYLKEIPEVDQEKLEEIVSKLHSYKQFLSTPFN